MQRFWLVALLLVAACSKGGSKSEGNSAASAVVNAAAPSASGEKTVELTRAWYVGSWKGEFAAARRTSATTTKQGAPGAWERDNGQRLAGPGTMEVTINDQGRVSGNVRGALGDIALRGQIDGEELRANLVASNEDPTAVQNGALVLTHDKDTLKGQLSAGSGDALALRQADVTLKKVSP